MPGPRPWVTLQACPGSDVWPGLVDARTAAPFADAVATATEITVATPATETTRVHEGIVLFSFPDQNRVWVTSSRLSFGEVVLLDRRRADGLRGPQGGGIPGPSRSPGLQRRGVTPRQDRGQGSRVCADGRSPAGGCRRPLDASSATSKGVRAFSEPPRSATGNTPPVR